MSLHRATPTGPCGFVEEDGGELLMAHRRPLLFGMSESAPSAGFTPFDRPVRAAFLGLGRIYDLNMRGYVDNDDVQVVAIVDPSDDRRAQR